MKYCTYRSQHPSGFYYQGKGLTHRVKAGLYKGSGTRFTLALQLAEFREDLWVTNVIAEYATEAEAFDAEAELVTIESLADPFCLNMQAGGMKGRGKNHGALLRSIKTKKRAEQRALRAAKKKEKDNAAKAKIRELKTQLRNKK